MLIAGFVLFCCVHFAVMLYAMHFVTKTKDKAISEGMSQKEAGKYAQKEFWRGQIKPGHPMFKVGIYNLFFAGVMVFMLYLAGPTLRLIAHAIFG